jgi:hypothetical protein
MAISSTIMRNSLNRLALFIGVGGERKKTRAGQARQDAEGAGGGVKSVDCEAENSSLRFACANCV